MAQIFEEIKFQNCIYENKCEAHIIKHLLKQLLVHLSTRRTETTAVLPSTVKHWTATSKYTIFFVMEWCFLEVLILIVYF